MKVRPVHVTLAAVVVIVGMAIAVTGGTQPGSVARDGGIITKTVSTAKPDSEAVFDIILQEGNDAEHESTHIFQQLEHPAIATLSLDTRTLKLTVAFDSAGTTEQALRSQLATTGYLARTAADATPAAMLPDGSGQTIHLVPGDILTPSFIHAVPSVPLTITFSPGTGHLASVTIPELGITQTLGAEGASITIPSPEPGEYSLVCLEGFTDAVLLVE